MLLRTEFEMLVLAATFALYAHIDSVQFNGNLDICLAILL